MTRLFYVLNEQGYLNPALNTAPADVLLLPMTDDLTAAIEFSSRLRDAGVRTQLYAEKKKMKAKMNYADKLGIPYVVFLGEDEIAAGTATVKNMQLASDADPAAKQVTLPAEEAAAYIRRALDEAYKPAPILDRE